MTEIMRVGMGSWVRQIIRRYTEPAGLVEMPSEPLPPAAPAHLQHPDCPRCTNGTCTVNHLLAGLGFMQPRSQEDRITWSSNVTESTLR